MAGLFTKLSFPKVFGALTHKPSAKSKTKDDLSPELLKDFVSDYNIRNSWAALYMQVVRSRVQFIQEIDKIKSFYLVDALARSVADDTLAPDITSGEIVEVGSSKAPIDKELKILQKRFDFDQIIGDFIIDLLRQGEHILAHTVKSGQGIVDIRDDVDQTKVLAFYKFGYPSLYLTQSDTTELKVYNPYAYSHFAINRYKLRVEVQQEFGKKTDVRVLVDDKGKELPSYARVGRSIFYGVLSKIKELMLIELMIPAKKLNDIMKGNLVGLRMPQSTTAKDAFSAAKVYEKFLNKKVGLDRGSDDFSVADIVGLAGSIRIVPILGEKGSLESLGDVKEDRGIEALADRVEDSRKVICTSIGYPYELLFGSEGERRGELLKDL